MKNSGKLWAVFIITLIAVCLVEHSYAIEINATDARGIRKFTGGDPFLLGFLAVKIGTFADGVMLDDRTVLEFDVSALAPAPSTTELLLPIENIDQPGGPPGSIDVFTFIGNGVVQAPDFFADDFFATIPTGNVNRETNAPGYEMSFAHA